MIAKLSGVGLFCLDHVVLARWYETVFGLEFIEAAGDVRVLTDGEHRIAFCQGKSDGYKNSVLYLTVDDYEAADRAIAANGGMKVHDLTLVREESGSTIHSALYEDVEGNVVELLVTRPL